MSFLFCDLQFDSILYDNVFIDKNLRENVCTEKAINLQSFYNVQSLQVAIKLGISLAN